MNIFIKCILDNTTHNFKVDEINYKNIIGVMNKKYNVSEGKLFIDDKEILSNEDNFTKFIIEDYPLTYYPQFIIETVSEDVVSIDEVEDENFEELSIDNHKGLHTLFLSMDPAKENFAKPFELFKFHNIFSSDDLNYESNMFLQLRASNCTSVLIAKQKNNDKIVRLVEHHDKPVMIMSKFDINKYDWFVCYSIPTVVQTIIINKKPIILDYDKWYSPLSGKELKNEFGSISKLSDGWYCYDDELILWCEKSNKCPKTGKIIL